jgi:hypothetical protein
MSEREPTQIVHNKRAPFDVVAGDYVFASRWGDCRRAATPRAKSALSYASARRMLRLVGFPRCWPCAMKIASEQGSAQVRGVSGNGAPAIVTTEPSRECLERDAARRT